MGVAVGIASLVLGAVGTGVSYAAQQSAAATQERFSMLNAQAGVQQAQQSGQLGVLQSQLQQTQAQVARDAAFQNSTATQQETEANAAAAAEDIRRQRVGNARQIAMQIAQGGASGALITTGSPLDFLINQSEQQQQTELDMQWQADADRRLGYRRAAILQSGGVTQDINSQLYQIEGMATQQAARTAATQARLGGLAGRANAQGVRYGALGSLIGQAANVSGQAYKYFS